MKKAAAVGIGALVMLLGACGQALEPGETTRASAEPLSSSCLSSAPSSINQTNWAGAGTATGDSSTHPSYPANYAIDVSASTTWLSTARASNRAVGWVYVDLGQTINIDSIYLNTGWQAKWYISVSDTSTFQGWNTVLDKGAAWNSATGTYSIKARGRYVRFANVDTNGDIYAHLYAFKVFGTSGYWGQTAEGKCAVTEWLYASGGPLHAQGSSPTIKCDANSNLLTASSTGISFANTAPRTSPNMGGGSCINDPAHNYDNEYYHDENWIARYAGRAYGQTDPYGLNALDTHWCVLEGDAISYGAKPDNTAPQDPPCAAKTGTPYYNIAQGHWGDIDAMNGLYHYYRGETTAALSDWSSVRSMWIASGYRYVSDDGDGAPTYALFSLYKIALFKILSARLGKTAEANQADSRLKTLLQLTDSTSAGTLRSVVWTTNYYKSTDAPAGCSNVETTAAAILALSTFYTPSQ